MARAEKKIHYIYKTTCLITNRYYIGMHSTNNLEDGYLGSGKRLRYSIRKHGKENHIKELLEFCNSREELAIRESEIITKEIINDVSCMNLVLGGSGFMLDDYHYECSKRGNDVIAKKRLEDLDWVEKYKMNQSNAQKKVYLDERREIKYFYDWTNKKHSNETKKLMSESKKVSSSGINNSQYGKCWITNGIMNKKIYKGDFIEDGWKLGRSIN